MGYEKAKGIAMNGLIEKPAYCPYCGEKIQLLVDESQGENRYIEDCSVCCRPMVVEVFWGQSNEICLELKTENDQ